MVRGAAIVLVPDEPTVEVGEAKEGLELFKSFVGLHLPALNDPRNDTEPTHISLP